MNTTWPDVALYALSLAALLAGLWLVTRHR